MPTCRICSHGCSSVTSYIFHLKYHKNLPNVKFHCPITDCNRSFALYASFKAHISRDHSKVKSDAVFSRKRNLEFSLTCNEISCSAVCSNPQELFKHLKGHIDSGLDIQCPFLNCTCKFRNKSTFSSHISRKHRGSLQDLASLVPIDIKGSEYLETCDSDSVLADDDITDLTDNNAPDRVSDKIDSHQFERSLALCYLKMQAKYILPASTIQNIIDDFQDMHSIGQIYSSNMLLTKLQHNNISTDRAQEISDELLRADLFRSCNMGTLRSDRTRKTYFKSNFNYVAPIEIYLGRDKCRRHRYFHYIPVQATLVALLQHESVRNHYLEIHKTQPHGIDILTDIQDGSNFKTNKLFQNEPSTLRLILYQDAFEVANPLGSGKKKHKILAVYMSIGDLMPYARSNIDHMQLVLLCREVDFKEFGQDKVFSRLIEDLKSLETTGIVSSLGTLKAGVFCFVGDNLGSHCIGGFSENFSTSHYFCRFCLIRRSSFHETPYATAEPRTTTNYETTLKCIEADPNSENFCIKFNSCFNALRYFHVCHGLPPCLGHDLFEGIVSYDLALILKYLVVKMDWFTYQHLNRSMAQFKFLANDANNKPNEVSPNAERLSGHAVQNWYLCRLLPILIGNKIIDFDDVVWQLFLQLREIVERVCAPKISLSQVAYLKVLIEEYLQSRQDVFSDQKLKPKHHYLAHYPSLILQFGPLIRLWTLRFESKHTYFKQCARKLHNFKNLCSTLAERHQLLQAYFNAGVLIPSDVQSDTGLRLDISIYSADIQDAISQDLFLSTDTVVSHSTTVKGTTYKKGLYVLLTETEDGLLTGKIVLILVRNNCDVFFVISHHHASHLAHLHVYCICTEINAITLVNVNDLLDYYPLPVYSMQQMQVFALHHMFVSK